jgi:hypothetical protein
MLEWSQNGGFRSVSEVIRGNKTWTYQSGPPTLGTWQHFHHGSAQARHVKNKTEAQHTVRGSSEHKGTASYWCSLHYEPTCFNRGSAFKIINSEALKMSQVHINDSLRKYHKTRDATVSRFDWAWILLHWKQITVKILVWLSDYMCPHYTCEYWGRWKKHHFEALSAFLSQHKHNCLGFLWLIYSNH